MGRVGTIAPPVVVTPECLELCGVAAKCQEVGPIIVNGTPISLTSLVGCQGPKWVMQEIYASSNIESDGAMTTTPVNEDLAVVSEGYQCRSTEFIQAVRPS